MANEMCCLQQAHAPYLCPLPPVASVMCGDMQPTGSVQGKSGSAEGRMPRGAWQVNGSASWFLSAQEETALCHRDLAVCLLFLINESIPHDGGSG